MSCYGAMRVVYGETSEVVWSLHGLPGTKSQRVCDVDDSAVVGPVK